MHEQVDNRRAPRRARFAAGPIGRAAAMLALGVASWVAVAGATAPVPAPHRRDAPQVPAATQEQRYVDALNEFHAQRYAAAYGRFARLADEGHVPSAVLALTLVSQGPSTFGSEWSATPGQLRRWSAMAARDLREHGVAIAEHDRGE